MPPFRIASTDAGEWDRRRCLFLTFSNSKFTGGKMMIAPKADPTDGRIEYVRWGPVGRLRLLWNLPRLFTGTHIEHPLASRALAAARRFRSRGARQRHDRRRNPPPAVPLARNSSLRAGRDRMRKAWLTVRSLVLWAVSGIHFAIVCTFLVVLGIFIDPRKNDWPQRVFFRNILRLAGVRFEVRRAPASTPRRTCIFICNHVNIFDPFVIYSAIPQFVRGFELESHFKIPVYGWMMGRFGNIPVPEAPSRAGRLKS